MKKVAKASRVVREASSLGAWLAEARPRQLTARPSMCEEWTAPDFCGWHPERVAARAIDRSLHIRTRVLDQVE